MEEVFVTLHRFAHVSSDEVQGLVGASIDEKYPAAVREASGDYVLTEDHRECKVEETGADAQGRNPYVAVWFSGLVTFRLNSGWGEKAVKDWRLSPNSLFMLRDMARERGYRVKVKNDRGKRRRAKKRPKNLPEEQVTMFGGNN